jgi:hypothetical protein
MKIQRFDHMHVSPENFDHFNERFETFLGDEYFMTMDMTDLTGPRWPTVSPRPSVWRPFGPQT